MFNFKRNCPIPPCSKESSVQGILGQIMMKKLIKKIIRFPFDILMIIYLNIIETRNIEYYFDFDDYYEEIERKYNIWVEKFDYKLGVLFWILMIVYFYFV